MKYFIKILRIAFHRNDHVDVANFVPLSLQTVRKILGIALYLMSCADPVSLYITLKTV